MTLSDTFRRILGLLKPHSARMIIALLAMIVTAATEPAVASLMKLLLDKGFSETRSFSLWMVPVFVVGIFVIRGLSTFTTSYLMSSVSGQLMSTLRQQMFSRLLDVPLSYYRENSTGKVISAMMVEVNQILDMIRNVMIVLIRDSLTVIGLLGYLLWLNWKLTLVTITLGPVIAFVVRLTA
jgi:subfamily B ATP-binding cassette protein MsbA